MPFRDVYRLKASDDGYAHTDVVADSIEAAIAAYQALKADAGSKATVIRAELLSVVYVDDDE